MIALMGLEIPKIEKAKIAIVNSSGEILTLTRSQNEDTRQGENDWPGGTLEDGETGLRGVLLREVETEELPGSRLHNIRPLDVRAKIENGGFKVSYLFAATATFPAEGIVLSDEHIDFAWIPQSEYPALTMPKKYKAAVAAGGPILNELAELAENDVHAPTN